MACTISSSLKKYCDSERTAHDVSKIRAIHYSRISDVDPEDWRQVVREDNRFMCLEYLAAMEEVHDKDLEVRCILFRDDEMIVGAAVFQVAHFITSDDAYSNRFLKLLNQATRFLRGKHIHNILICGNAIATGEHGFAFRKGVGPKEISILVAGAMKEIAANEKEKGRRICAMVVKDFYPGSTAIADELSGARFRKFQVDHNMVMPLLPEWQTFEDYMSAMNTKFRTKAKAAITKSSPLQVHEISGDEIEQHLDRLSVLYNNVHLKADFRLGKLDVATLPLLLKRLKGFFTVKTYSFNNEIVGFITAMQSNNCMEAHIIGIDYDHNRDLAIYQRMLYDFVELAIRNKCSRIVFGRTAAEIKSTVGAFPVDLTCCVLHQRRISNALLSLILQYVKPSDYPQRQPYRNEVFEQIKEQPLY